MSDGNGHSYNLCLGCGDTGEMVVEQVGGIRVTVPCYYCQVPADADDTEEELPEMDDYPEGDDDVDEG